MLVLLACRHPLGEDISEAPTRSTAVDTAAEPVPEDSAEPVDSAEDTAPPDLDGDDDGSPDTDDCAPDDPSVYPGAPDPCWDGVDRSCGGTCSWTGARALADAPLTFAGSPGDQAGDWVAVAAPHILVGASGVGAAYVLDTDGAVLATLTGEGVGWAVDSGDLDGDGFLDLALAAPEQGGDGVGFGPGAVYVAPGPHAGEVALTDPFLGIDHDFYGTSLAVGDVDGDALDDLAVGAIGHADEAGAVFIGTTKLRGPSPGEWAGGALALSDMDGDGIEDVLVAANGHRAADLVAAAIFSLPTGTVAWTDADAVILPEDDDDRTGNPVQAGDIDADGHNDLLIGAIGDEGRGSALVLRGPLAGTYDLAYPYARIAGVAEGDEAGSALALADVDGDGAEDVWIGAQKADAVYLVLAPFSGRVDLTASFRLQGPEGSEAGECLAAGDVDGDGAPDLVVGGWMDSGTVWGWWGP